MKERQIYAIVQETPEGGADLSALLYAKELADCRVTAIGINTERAIRHALACGCDQTVLIQMSARPCALQRANVLAAYFEEHPFDLILASAFQADEESLPGSMILFERLGLPAIHGADRIERVSLKEADSLVVRKSTAEAVVTSRIAFPAGISVTWKKNPNGVQVGRLLEAYRSPVESVEFLDETRREFLPAGQEPIRNSRVRLPEKVDPEEAALRILQIIREVRQ